jgi:uncharacterized protein YqcC (DUF446 family)
MTHPHPQQLLQAIEEELRRLQLWDSKQPDLRAFQSPNPFCCDTMELHEWLRWVFMPRINMLLEQGYAMPSACDIASYAEVMYEKSTQDVTALIESIRAFDRYCQNTQE